MGLLGNVLVGRVDWVNKAPELLGCVETAGMRRARWIERLKVIRKVPRGVLRGLWCFG